MKKGFQFSSHPVSAYESYGAESFEDFKRIMIGDGWIAGDMGYMEGLEEYYNEYLEDFTGDNPESFEDFQERILREDYADKNIRGGMNMAETFEKINVSEKFAKVTVCGECERDFEVGEKYYHNRSAKYDVKKNKHEYGYYPICKECYADKKKYHSAENNSHGDLCWFCMNRMIKDKWTKKNLKDEGYGITGDVIGTIRPNWYLGAKREFKKPICAKHYEYYEGGEVKERGLLSKKEAEKTLSAFLNSKKEK